MNNYQLLLELSGYDLEGRTRNIMGPERDEKSSRVQVDNLTFIPMVPNGKLKVGSNTTSNNGHDYWSTILFEKIDYQNEPVDEEGEEETQAAPSASTFTFTANDNSEYTIDRVPASTQVRVNCSCLDFHFRFSVWNNRFKSLDGTPPPPYTRASNRPPVNPAQSPGLCKHLIKLMDNLKQQNFFK